MDPYGRLDRVRLWVLLVGYLAAAAFYRSLAAYHRGRAAYHRRRLRRLAGGEVPEARA